MSGLWKARSTAVYIASAMLLSKYSGGKKYADGNVIAQSNTFTDHCNVSGLPSLKITCLPFFLSLTLSLSRSLSPPLVCIPEAGITTQILKSIF